MSLLLHSGAVYAYYDRDDDWHARMRSLLDGERGPLLLPQVVVPEVDHLLGARLGQAAQLALYEDVVAHVYHPVDLPDGAWPRILELNRRFADLRLGFVDAAVAVIASGLATPRVATTDRRHFPALTAVIPLELLP